MQDGAVITETKLGAAIEILMWTGGVHCLHAFPHVCQPFQDCHPWGDHFMVTFWSLLNSTFSFDHLPPSSCEQQLLALACRWFMPVNIGFTFLFGGVLGWIVVKVLKPEKHLEGLVIATCSAGLPPVPYQNWPSMILRKAWLWTH